MASNKERGRRTKTNTTYFADIPKAKDAKRLAWERGMALARLVSQRTIILRESREIRKKLYNLSQEIHSIELELVMVYEEERNVKRQV